jgi:taurine dioxygenase
LLKITPTGATCGATITGINLAKPLTADTITTLRAAWIEHQVIVFPEQELGDADLVRITNYFGAVGDDPYFVPINKHTPVVALTRRADEQAPVFAEVWHTDWSFKKEPPIGTCLYSLTIPPTGGDTGFSNQYQALAEMPNALRARLENKVALHCAAAAYGPDGAYGVREKGSDRSMKILYSESAKKLERHPIITVHPESGRETLFGTAGYISAIEGMTQKEADELIKTLYQWQTRAEYQYTHKWQEKMLVIWDNRCLLHKANGGYDGYARELHRTTIAGDPSLCL